MKLTLIYTSVALSVVMGVPFLANPTVEQNSITEKAIEALAGNPNMDKNGMGADKASTLNTSQTDKDLGKGNESGRKSTEDKNIAKPDGLKNASPIEVAAFVSGEESKVPDALADKEKANKTQAAGSAKAEELKPKSDGSKASSNGNPVEVAAFVSGEESKVPNVLDDKEKANKTLSVGSTKAEEPKLKSDGSNALSNGGPVEVAAFVSGEESNIPDALADKLKEKKTQADGAMKAGESKSDMSKISSNASPIEVAAFVSGEESNAPDALTDKEKANKTLSAGSAKAEEPKLKLDESKASISGNPIMVAAFVSGEESKVPNALADKEKENKTQIVGAMKEVSAPNKPSV